MHFMFAYGLNTNPRSMLERCPGARLMGPAWLDGYAFRWRGFADIELDPDLYTLGVLWEISDEDLYALDRFEGVPRHYTRQRVIISTLGESYRGWAYMMANQGSEHEPNEAYREAVFEGYDQNSISDQQLVDGLARLGVVYTG